MESALTLHKYPKVAVVLSGSIFLALMSQLAIPLPYTIVPFTMQTLGVFLIGGFLGSRLGAATVLAYLGQGTLGLPVFAGGVSNPLWFLAPNAGFLFSFVAAAWLIGWMLEKRPQAGFLYILLALIMGQLIIFLLGASWLALFVGLPKSFILGVTPFFFGAGCKIVAGTLILKGAL